MANVNFIGRWKAIQVQAQDGTVRRLKNNDIADIVIEEDMLGYLSGHMERKKMFGRVDSADVVVSETNNPDTIQIMQGFNVLIATLDDAASSNQLKTTWFSNTPHMDGIVVTYQKQ